MIESTKKEYTTKSMAELEDFIGFKIKCDLTNMTLNIYQPYLINNMTKLFNEDLKSFMTLKTPATPNKENVSNQETYTNYHTIYIRNSGVA